ncbi:MULTISPECIES: CoA-acylating methylmalonate-semialdehyde dehydrogenase [Halostella]|uniref:CoA-acylating methylmalonate-semialdehyde dehydrogenase n=1 Tax=Halostella TaxID=1843185 RepID=UPI001877E1C9|nr:MULTISPECIES: CoA-acylating methylmalonate-semialdehyde dehydrogenase [Halostella]
MTGRLREGTPVENYVGGEWADVDTDARDLVENPATGDVVGETPLTAPADVDAAVAKADVAFGQWCETPVEDRIQPLFRLKALLEERQDEIAEVIATEHGKTVDEARGELRRGIENVEVACGAPTSMQAGHLEHAAPGIDETAVRKPLGVFAAITPFNFPGMIPLWFLPYAVATGNTFVLKPSERTPCTARAIYDLVDEAGFPDGVVNLVNGGKETANALLENDDVVGVSFVGSTGAARHVYETAAANGKRVQAQGGAKNHIIVSASANLDFAAEQTVSSAFANTGQRCLANPVAVVADAVYEAFASKVVERASSLTVADGRYAGTDMGPLVSGSAKSRVLNYIETGIGEGADLLLDGREADVPDEGYFLGPTVFGDVEPDMVIAREEIFGPVLALIRASDFDDALSTLNKSDFGNAASLFTDSGREAREFRRRAEAGNLGINVGTAAPMAFFHFGGHDDSFFGDLHAQGDDAVRFYTDEAVYIERWPDDDS